jgi:hypothetical protein
MDCNALQIAQSSASLKTAELVVLYSVALL